MTVVPDQITLRPAQPEDRDALIRLFNDTFETTWKPRITPEAVESYRQNDPAGNYVAAMAHEFIVAENAGEVAGVVHWRESFVHAVHVLSSHRRKGLASRLMDFAEARIASAGYETVRLETDTFNEPSQALYRNRGYHEIDRYPDKHWNSGLTTVLLEKRLRE